MANNDEVLQNLRKTLENRHRKLVDDYDKVLSQSNRTVLDNLKPGQKVPDLNMIQGAEYVTAYNDMKSDTVDTMLSDVEKVHAAFRAKLSEAPSDDAIKALQVLKLRDHVRPEELQAMIEQYGENHLVRTVLHDIAEKHRINIPIHNDDKVINVCERLKSDIPRIYTGVNPGSAFFDFTMFAIFENAF